MPLDISINLPNSVPEKRVLSHDSFRKGVITLLDRSRIPRDALVEAKNLVLGEDGTVTVRPGVDWYGTAASSDSIDGAAMYETANGVPHLLKVAGGTVYRSLTDGATWEACTGATLTAGHKVYMVQDRGYMYISNGEDNITRYDGSTTLQSYTALTTPTAPTVAKTGLTGTGYKHYYKYSAVNSIGFTIASGASTLQESSLPRVSWDSTNLLTVTGTVVTGADRYDWYYSSDNVDFYYVGTTVGNSSITFRDDGTNPVNTNVIAPIDNTTQGPKVQRLEQIGSRLWGVGDKDNPWRIWFSGSGPYSGYFSAAYDGGYVDLMKGSQFRPVRVVDYRDGKGTPYATVWFDSPDGRGCIWQISLEMQTYGSVTVTVPVAYRLPGSRGTDAPDSVVNVLNDYLFYNSQAVYNLGTRPQVLNILSTDEVSANIRPTVRRINSTVSSSICAFYDGARVYMSVPVGTSTTEKRTMVLDTERRAWMPEAFMIGFERFFVYSDSNGARHLLAWKAGDTKLSEIGDHIMGDYGEAFTTVMATGLYPIDKNRFEFMYVEEGEVELSNPRGNVYIEILGNQRSRGFYTVNSETVSSSSVINEGWDTLLWDTYEWDYVEDIIEVFSETSVKRYFRVQKELNSYQWRIVTHDIDANYIMRTLQINGTITNSGKPRQWRI